MINLLRLILLFIVGLFGYNFFKGLFGSEEKPTVRGKRRKDNLNLRDEDVQDAKFRDVD